ncbi:MAG: histidine--tRNA ligase [Saprospiraceae bacterium]|nr:histidine--tRNA ligase [Saprospiraceae bacterium]
MSQKPSLAKGTRDFLPEQALKRKYIFQVIESEFKANGFQPLETPAMENLTTLEGKYGDEGDKLLFRILNSGDYLKDLSPEKIEQGIKAVTSKISEKGLRYDLTVPFARVVAMNRHLINFPFKRYQIQPVWRADRPQRGRYREFYQCDADVVGSDSLMYESELILIYDRVFKKLGIPVKIIINHRAILEGLAEYAGRLDLFMQMTLIIDKLDKIGKDAVCEELIVAGFEAEKANEILALLESNDLLDRFDLGSISSKGVATIKEIQSYFQDTKLSNPLEFRPSLARGLSYYTGCILEVVPQNIKMGSLGGGGRYDNLTGVFGLPGVSGVGISFGADRIYDVLEEQNLFPEGLSVSTQLLIICLDEVSHKHGFTLASRLREKNISTELYPEPTKIKKQFKYAEDLKIPYVLIVGEEERTSKIYNLKNQIDGSQRKVGEEELVGIISQFENLKI